jgi:Rha family phage regulatory protein
MVDLVSIKDGEVLVDSLTIAEKFDKPHKRVLNAIEKLSENLEKTMDKKVSMLKNSYVIKESSHKVNNRSFPCYKLNRKAFSLVAMGFTGKKALIWKMQFLEAFDMMEKSLLNKKDMGWKQVRSDSKIARLEFTGCIKEFVEYAKNQGSQSANKYYMNLTKMEYAALRMIEYREKVPSNFRDTLDRMQLFMLVMAEHVANETIKQGMEEELHYKEIFLLAKQAVLKYAETVLFDKRIE